jgi:hypothetical protein
MFAPAALVADWSWQDGWNWHNRPSVLAALRASRTALGRCNPLRRPIGTKGLIRLMKGELP